jgi:hypothetical protein
MFLGVLQPGRMADESVRRCRLHTQTADSQQHFAEHSTSAAVTSCQKALTTRVMQEDGIEN